MRAFVVLIIIAWVPELLAQHDYQFTLLAGSGGTSSSLDGDRAEAAFLQPHDIAMDVEGNLYVADTGNSLIRKITPTGVVTTLAGQAGVTGVNDGTGAAARFNQPNGIAVDSTGQIYVADSYNNTIRRISPAGEVVTIAGLGGVSGGNDGMGDAARFNNPSGLCVDASGNVFVADAVNSVIRKITPAGVVTTLAGVAGSMGTVDGIGANARFSLPIGLCIDPAGNLFVTDSNNHAIRRISPEGEVTTIAGLPGTAGSVDGTAAAARFTNPTGIARDAAGNLYVSERYNQTIRRISPDGMVTTVAGVSNAVGFVDGSGAVAKFRSPWGLWVDMAGRVLIADASNHAIRQIDVGGAVSTIAGGIGAPGDSDGIAAAARFNSPFFMAAGAEGKIYVADTANNKIRQISAAGTVTTLAEGVGLSQVYGVAVDEAGYVYATDASSRIYKISPAGEKTVFAGGATLGNVDGVGEAARFSVPLGVAVDRLGVLYVVDRNTNVIRKITPEGTVSTWVGVPGMQGSDDGVGNQAKFYFPDGIAVDRDGTAYVTDGRNHTIRRISAEGNVTTLAGLAGAPGMTDGTGSAARFTSPTGIAVDAHGYVYVADSGNGTLRGVSPEGVVTTLGGIGQIKTYLNGVGGGARFAYPHGVTVDPDGRIYVSDAYYHTIVVATNQSTPAITIPPVSQTVAETDPVTLSVGTTGGYVNYQWRRNGEPIPDATRATLVIANVSVDQSGSYDVVVSNLHGSVTSPTVTLTVRPIPVITAFSPARQLAATGDALNLAVTATGTGALHYQWRRNGVSIPGATSSTYSVTAAGLVDRGWYQVLVTDDYGTRRSLPSFVLVAPTLTQVVAWGSNYDGQTTVPAGLGDVVALAAGEAHVLALKADGTVVAWGNNYNGQTQVPAGLNDVVAVAAGGSHSLALKSDGSVVAWGDNYYGQCNVPVGLGDVVALAAGETRSLALKSDGTVVTWGTGIDDPVPMPGNLSDIIAVSAGQGLGLALRGDGSVVAWGYNNYGVTTPPEGLAASAVSGGGGYALALKNDGAVTGWGSNDSEQLDVPGELTGAVAISAGYDHALALRSDGTVASWGSNAAGQAAVPIGLTAVWSIAAGGNYSLALRAASTDPVPEVSIEPASQTIAEASPLVLSVTAEGVGVLGYQWRKNGDAIPGATASEFTIDEAELADAGSYDVVVYNHAGPVTSAAAVVTILPIPVVTAQSAPRQVFVPGDELNLFVTATGTGTLNYQWLRNGEFVAGATSPDLTVSGLSPRDGGWYVAVITDQNGTRYSKPMFVIVAPAVTQVVNWGRPLAEAKPIGLNDAIDVAMGDGFILALKRDGTVVGWGSQINGSLDIPDGLTDVVALSTCYNYVLALKSDGTVVSWGVLPNGEFPDTSALHDIVAISAGPYHGLMLRNNGKVVAMGGYYTDYPANIVPTGLTDVAAIATGNNFSQALTRQGQVVFWGSDALGHLHPPEGLSDVTNLVSGDSHTLAMRADGTVVAWGENYYGLASVPADLTEVIAIAAGYQHSLALKADGTIVAWGRNDYGQIDMPSGLNAVFDVKAGILSSVALRDATSGAIAEEQVITFPLLSNRPFSSAGLILSATANSGLPVTYMVVSGPATISGNQLTLTAAGTVTVRASQPGDENYLAADPVDRTFTVSANEQSWAATHFTTEELADAAVSAPTADPDGDGLSNLLEYALGLDPKSTDTTGLPEMSTTATDWVYTYTRPTDRSDITYTVEVSTDLNTWTDSGVTLIQLSADNGTETWQATYPLGSADKVFFHLKVWQP